MSGNKQKLVKEIFSYLKIFSVAMVITFVVTHGIIVNAQTPTSSMENTIKVGDRYFGNRLAYVFDEPQRQDIIIFRFPDDEKKIYV
ncbi:MAG: S26 family signal peptidase, partial [Eubacteriales bacterium]|nr:S26 family signal peptidase [Eubacteriales bacterium]